MGHECRTAVCSQEGVRLSCAGPEATCMCKRCRRRQCSEVHWKVVGRRQGPRRQQASIPSSPIVKWEGGSGKNDTEPPIKVTAHFIITLVSANQSCLSRLSAHLLTPRIRLARALSLCPRTRGMPRVGVGSCTVKEEKVVETRMQKCPRKSKATCDEGVQEGNKRKCKKGARGRSVTELVTLQEVNERPCKERHWLHHLRSLLQSCLPGSETVERRGLMFCVYVSLTRKAGCRFLVRNYCYLLSYVRPRQRLVFILRDRGSLRMCGGVVYSHFRVRLMPWFSFSGSVRAQTELAADADIASSLFWCVLSAAEEDDPPLFVCTEPHLIPNQPWEDESVWKCLHRFLLRCLLRPGASGSVLGSYLTFVSHVPPGLWPACVSLSRSSAAENKPLMYETPMKNEHNINNLQKSSPEHKLTDPERSS
ncbi:hypothetical protein NDU88_007729 [Pleurodeles waltl]|uniref:Nuclear receptor domain-containing protein n=1 Tax=Pleurodeles waltl TaxID=8319 RepID=A0AAV7STC5_PLEWA|nr:hypothetical protein NDU88_007729 [Pleurodeles waltl]